jgi:sugar lactone lactonase YvrE
VSVASGAQESLYVVDGTTIVHVSATGRLLGRVGHTQAPLATDATGNLTFAEAGQVVTLGPDGTVLQRWPAGDAQALAIGRQGAVYVATAVGAAGAVWRVRRFSAAGRLLSAWQTPYAESLAVGGDGAVYGIGGGALVRMDGRSGRVLRRWGGAAGQGTTSYDAVAADGRGTIYVGVTERGAAPFAIERLQTGRGFVTVNTAQELVAGLAIDGQGHMYVIRSSYARPCPSNIGLDKLAPTGQVLGTFRQPCAG